MSIVACISFAQPSSVKADVVYKEWQVFAESKNRIEIFYCVVKCNGVNKVNLMIFNDGADDKEVQFTLDIANSGDNRHFSVKRKFSAKKGVFHKGTCDDDTNSELKIKLPDTYNPSGILVRQVL